MKRDNSWKVLLAMFLGGSVVGYTLMTQNIAEAILIWGLGAAGVTGAVYGFEYLFGDRP